MVGMSNTPTSTGHVSRPAKRSGSLQPTGSGRKKLRVVISGINDNKMDDVLPPIPPKQVTPTNKSNKRKQVTNEGEMTTRQDSGAEQKRKSMRRSSFVRGRISMAMPVTSVTQLSSNIPQDLPEDERLMKLSMSALEHTLEKLSDEFSTFDGMQQFKVLARDAVDRTVQALKDNGTLTSLTVTDSRAPNPVNIDLESTIKTYEEYIAKLQTETARWDAVVELRRRLAEEAERDETAAADDVITEPLVPLSVEQETFLSKKPNYTALMEELKTFREQALIAANEMLEGTKVMDRLMEIATVVVQEQARLLLNMPVKGRNMKHFMFYIAQYPVLTTAQKTSAMLQLLHVHSFESIKNFDSPRTLLSSLE